MATASLYTSLSSSSSFCVDGGVDLIRIWDPITAMAGAASALFLLDIKGRVLIWRDYRGDVSALDAERFFTKLIEKQVPSPFPLSLSLSLSLVNLISHSHSLSSFFFFVEGRSASSRSGCARQRRDLHVHPTQQRVPHDSHQTELQCRQPPLLPAPNRRCTIKILL